MNRMGNADTFSDDESSLCLMIYDARRPRRAIPPAAAPPPADFSKGFVRLSRGEVGPIPSNLKPKLTLARNARFSFFPTHPLNAAVLRICRL